MSEENSRSYQLEMFEESISTGNAFVCMDTGTGKTHVAFLRMRRELQQRKSPNARVWFICPTTVLAQQQHDRIAKYLAAYSVKCFTGADGIDAWTTQAVWDAFLANVDVVVCTIDVLRHARSHAFVAWSSVCLLVVDEMHHATKKHPLALLLRAYRQDKEKYDEAMPPILGLSASAVGDGRADKVNEIEHTTCSKIITPKKHRDELLQRANRPRVDVVRVPPTAAAEEMPEPTARSLLGSIVNRPDKELVSRLQRTVKTIYDRLGLDALTKLLGHLQRHYGADMPSARDPARYLPSPQRRTKKLTKLFELLKEIQDTKGRAIVFVQTRSATHILSSILNEHPNTREFITARSFVSPASVNSDSWSRSLCSNQDTALSDLRLGEINVLVATSVLEEGIDVSSCNLVVCYDECPNYKSLIQRRGRARAGSSRMVILESDEKKINKIQKLLSKEVELAQMFVSGQRPNTVAMSLKNPLVAPLEHPDTRAQIGLEDAVSHLYHFCAKLSQGDGIVPVPVFKPKQVDENLFTCEVILPASVLPSTRIAVSSRQWDNPDDAKRDAALAAYKNLYEHGYLDEHLLPLVSHSKIIKNLIPDKRLSSSKSFPAQWNPWPRVATKLQSHIDDRCNAVTVWWYKVIIAPSNENRYSFWICSRELVGMSPFDFVYGTAKVTVGMAQKGTLTKQALTDLTTLTVALLNSALNVSDSISRTALSFLFAPYLVKDESSITDILLSSTQSQSFSSLNDSLAIDGIGLVRKDTRSTQRYLLVKILNNCQIKLIVLPKPLKPLDMKTACTQGLQDNRIIRLNSDECHFDRIPLEYIEYALYLPHVFWHWRLRLSADTVSTRLWPKPACNDTMVSMVVRAISTPRSSESFNYEQLEFLGDSVLKYFATLNLMCLFPQVSEGVLTEIKSVLVSNERLAQVAIDLNLVDYIITERLTDKLNLSSLGLHQRLTPRTISPKMLADVVEAIIAVSYEYQTESATANLLCKLLDFIPWKSPDTCRAKLDSYHEHNDALARTTQHATIQHLTTHTFANPSLLYQALTHHSCIEQPYLRSYERLEFLGDAVYELLITQKLAALNLEPVQMHRIRAALVNRHFQAYCILSRSKEYIVTQPSAQFLAQARTTPAKHHASLVVRTEKHTRKQCLVDFIRAMSSSGVYDFLQEARHTFDALREKIDAALWTGTKHPWSLLVALRAPKLVADIFESILGAVYLDSDGDQAACLRMLQGFGVLKYLDRVVTHGIQAVHPIEDLHSRLGGRKMELVLDPSDDKDVKTVSLKVDDEVVCSTTAGTRDEAELGAAERGMAILFSRA